MNPASKISLILLLTAMSPAALAARVILNLDETIVRQ